jgi:Glycosyltransferase like family
MSNPVKTRIVCATRKSLPDFINQTALGRSLSVYNFPFLEIRVYEENTLGLPIVYNHALQEAINDPAILVFIHDDVCICDFHWINHILEALLVFELVGLAGNKRRVPRQPSWAFVDEKFTWDAPENLSGLVGHGNEFPPQWINVYGASRQEVKLLDGLMLACHSQTLLEKNIWFDEQFDFHFYDLDLCRQAENNNLKMGTWDISVIHESGGDFYSEGWQLSYAKYLSKWRS